MVAAVCWPRATAAQTATSYTASWSSLNKHPPAPEWFQDAKFGIYFHWGAYSVPAFGSEWYPRNMYNKAGSSAEYNHHLSVYGDPFGQWPFNDFLSGANDKSGKFVQFAPKLVSNGGNWDPNAWAQIFVNAGARYAGPSMEHHDGYSMWDSKVNPWNSVAYGPKLNLAQLHVNAYRSAGLKIVAALHTAYHFNGYYQYAPAQTDPNLKILYGQTGTASENDLWLGKIKEVVDEFQPDILWQDFDLNVVDPTHLLESLQYYYNAALGWGKEVVATYKDGYNNQGEVYDYERGGPAGITTPYWLTDDAVGVNSWCYTQGMAYYSPQAVLDAFIDRVSKGGNLLLNISPMWDGTIPQQQLTILSTIGSFLKQNGTAIYDTRAWTVYGEGPTKMGGGSFTNPTAGTASDVRYTKSKDGSALYAIWMGWPGNGKQVTMASVTTTAFPVGNGKVYLFGADGRLSHRAHLHAGQLGIACHASERAAVHRGGLCDGDQPERHATGTDPLARQRRNRWCRWHGRGRRGRCRRARWGGAIRRLGRWRFSIRQRWCRRRIHRWRRRRGRWAGRRVERVRRTGRIGRCCRTAGSGGTFGTGTGTGGALAGTGGSSGEGGAGAGPGGAPGGTGDAAGGCNCRLHEGPTARPRAHRVVWRPLSRASPSRSRAGAAADVRRRDRRPFR